MGDEIIKSDDHHVIDEEQLKLMWRDLYIKCCDSRFNTSMMKYFGITGSLIFLVLSVLVLATRVLEIHKHNAVFITICWGVLLLLIYCSNVKHAGFSFLQKWYFSCYEIGERILKDHTVDGNVDYSNKRFRKFLQKNESMLLVLALMHNALSFKTIRRKNAIRYGSRFDAGEGHFSHNN